MPKKKKISVSFKKEKINYDKVKHTTSVDQSCLLYTSDAADD